MSDQPQTNKQYVVYRLEDGTCRQHGGPYTPAKARGVRDSMETHIENGNLAEWDIPKGAVDVFLSDGREIVEEDGTEQLVWTESER